VGSTVGAADGLVAAVGHGMGALATFLLAVLSAAGMR
jgi:hypothetical protein